MIARILPILALVLAVGLFFGYINPTYTGSIKTLQTDISGDDAALASANTFKQKEAELTQQRNTIPQDQIDRLQTFLPDGVDNVQMILDLDALAARSGIQLSDFNISGNTDNTSSSTPTSFADLSVNAASPTDSLDLTVNAVGSYQAFRTFLAGIEDSLRPLDVTDITVSDSPTGVYTYNMTLRLYWLH